MSQHHTMKVYRKEGVNLQEFVTFLRHTLTRVPQVKEDQVSSESIWARCLSGILHPVV
jgi:hypothetical protein